MLKIDINNNYFDLLISDADQENEGFCSKDGRLLYDICLKIPIMTGGYQIFKDEHGISNVEVCNVLFICINNNGAINLLCKYDETVRFPFNCSLLPEGFKQLNDKLKNIINTPDEIYDFINKLGCCFSTYGNLYQTSNIHVPPNSFCIYDIELLRIGYRNTLDIIDDLIYDVNAYMRNNNEINLNTKICWRYLYKIMMKHFHTYFVFDTDYVNRLNINQCYKLALHLTWKYYEYLRNPQIKLTQTQKECINEFNEFIGFDLKV